MSILVLALVVGGAWGFILHRSSVCEYGCIVGGLLTKNLVMIKIIMTSIITTIVIAYPLHAMGMLHFIPKPTYLLGNIVGGLIFGIGMAMAGSCPGTTIASLGAGRKDALTIIVGGLFGAVLYSISYPFLKPLLITPLNFGAITLPGVLLKIGIPEIVSSLLLAAIFVGIVVLISRSSKPKSSSNSHRSAF